MAYTLFTEVAEGRTASVDQKFNRTYTRVFLVRTDAASYGPAYAASHPSLPVIFSAHNEDANAYCLSISPSQDQGDPTLWRISVNYGYNVDLRHPVILRSRRSRQGNRPRIEKRTRYRGRETTASARLHTRSA